MVRCFEKLKKIHLLMSDPKIESIQEFQKESIYTFEPFATSSRICRFVAIDLVTPETVEIYFAL